LSSPDDHEGFRCKGWDARYYGALGAVSHGSKCTPGRARCRFRRSPVTGVQVALL
jgi:hypothetical protein